MSTDNIFNEPLPISLLDDFLKRNCIKEMKSYRFNSDMFKRGVMNGNITTFCYELIFYYNTKKLGYIQRNHTYKTFLTVLRHVLKHFGVHYENHVKYDRSTYSIEYVIEYPGSSGKGGKGDKGKKTTPGGKNTVLSGKDIDSEEVTLDLTRLKPVQDDNDIEISTDVDTIASMAGVVTEADGVDNSLEKSCYSA